MPVSSNVSFCKYNTPICKTWWRGHTKLLLIRYTWNTIQRKLGQLQSVTTPCLPARYYVKGLLQVLVSRSRCQTTPNYSCYGSQLSPNCTQGVVVQQGSTCFPHTNFTHRAFFVWVCLYFVLQIAFSSTNCNYHFNSLACSKHTTHRYKD